MNETMTDPIGDPSPPVPPAPRPAPSNPFAGYRRSSSDRWFSGIAGGVARQLNIDVRIVRLVAVGFAIAGIGVPAYLLVWLLAPADDSPSVAVRKGWSRTTVIAVAVLAVVLAFSVAGTIGDHPGQVVPWAIVAVGVWLIVRPHDPTRAAADPPGTASNPAAGPAGAAGPATVEMPAGGASTTPVTDPSRPSYRPPIPRPRPFLTPLALAVSVIVAGVAVLVGHGTWTRPGMVGAIALLTFGVALVCSAFVGRARGLIAIGAIIAVPVLIGTAIDGRWGDWRSDWTASPGSIQDLDGRYERGFGQSRLDLSAVRFIAGQTRSVEFRQLAGDATVVLPRDATVDIVGRVAAGELVLDSSATGGVERSGCDNLLRQTVVTGSGSSHVSIDAQLWAGRLQILDPSPLPAPSTPVSTVPPNPSTPGVSSAPTSIGAPR